jgi:vitamin B12 transporter
MIEGRLLMSCSKIAIHILLVAIFFSVSTSAFAVSEEEKSFVSLWFTEDELNVVSTTRSLKSITRVAENVEVVTKEDIELMNAHTLTDVLNTINGVFVVFGGASPGSIVSVGIQGSEAEQVVVFIDGIAINFISSDQADFSSIPVQIIDRVEVIKGPASSVWGSALGGVINVITKSPGKKEGTDGTISTSYGEKNTDDFRAEVSGRKDSLGYYLYAGRLQTDGLRPVENISSDNLYAKFIYDVSSNTNVGLTLFYNKGDREEGDFSADGLYIKNRIENLLTTVNLNSSLSEGLALNLSLRAARQRTDLDVETLSTGETLTTPLDDKKYGASAKLIWKTGVQNIVLGSDYDFKKETSTIYLGEMPHLNVFAVYANDTITISKLSITPGIRYDRTDRDFDFTSPSLGITYELCDKTLLRADVARGFHLPNLGALVADGLFSIHNPNLRPEEVWSYQAGVESGLPKYLWLKVSAFIYDISDAIISVPADPNDPNNGITTEINAEKVRRQGVELEMRTVKFYNFTLATAATFVHSKDLTTGEEIQEWPDYTYDVNLKYDDENSFKALLKGRYVWWHLTSDYAAKYNSFIFDLNLIKTIVKKENGALEVFLSGHNIFNGTQYIQAYENAANARRWVEAGVRYKF